MSLCVSLKKREDSMKNYFRVCFSTDNVTWLSGRAEKIEL